MLRMFNEEYKDMKVSSRLLYIYLGTKNFYAGNILSLSHEVGMSTNTVKRGLGELVKRGLVRETEEGVEVVRKFNYTVPTEIRVSSFFSDLERVMEKAKELSERENMFDREVPKINSRPKPTKVLFKK